MSNLTRRHFLEMAAAMGATAAWSDVLRAPSGTGWKERRDRFPEGVASGDPDSTSVLVWTRCPQEPGSPPRRLTVEVAEDEGFRKVVLTETAPIARDSDWTCRVLA